MPFIGAKGMSDSRHATPETKGIASGGALAMSAKGIWVAGRGAMCASLSERPGPGSPYVQEVTTRF